MHLINVFWIVLLCMMVVAVPGVESYHGKNVRGGGEGTWSGRGSGRDGGNQSGGKQSDGNKSGRSNSEGSRGRSGSRSNGRRL
ncbi:hypothetical protein OESDEN_05024 [Oesophagostomum dentatum]|uniref:Uncharacterized protein n=1 Tax=Oesophagostomum dentatum TaxID=61180 RepID=A0A0B1TGU4_OESDE|nr:hypothetical protein OESDEN_05024 [Oesophagostomum dentatum]